MAVSATSVDLATPRKGSSRSRSTSAGSSPASSLPGDSSSHSSPACNGALAIDLPQLETARTQNMRGLPDFEYPTPFVVRNTFLDTKALVPASLVEFFQERQVHSCPASGIGAPPGLEHLASQISEEADEDFLPALIPEQSYPPVFGRRGLEGLPEFDYPSPLVVKNTFLDMEMRTPGSLADFMQERQANSCPASGACLPPGVSGCSFRTGGDEMDEDMELQDSYVGGKALSGAAQELSAFFPPFFACPSPPLAPPPMVPPLAPPPMVPPSAPPPLPPFAPPPPPDRAPELRIAESLPTPGEPELPSVGSAGHRFGMCKPCAFMFTKGCESGVDCIFCHLCPPGEKKRRQKIKQVANKAFGYNSMRPPMSSAVCGWGAGTLIPSQASVYMGAWNQAGLL